MILTALAIIRKLFFKKLARIFAFLCRSDWLMHYFSPFDSAGSASGSQTAMALQVKNSTFSVTQSS